jgi:hypothetical protein
MSGALRQGDRGQAVLLLQRALNARGADLYADGDFGELTEAAVCAFQLRVGLVVDGIAGPKTQAALRGESCAVLLQQADLASAADRLGVPVAVVLAVNEVESRGEGFLSNGKPQILFERHIMYRRLASIAADRAADLARRYPQIVNARPGGYIGGSAEHQRLAQARQVDDACALESASWGLFQIMGFHWQALGYASAADFASRMAADESAQLDAFVRFILADPDLHKALKARKWAQFARRYNGPNYAANLYDTKLARAYERHAARLAPAETAHA